MVPKEAPFVACKRRLQELHEKGLLKLSLTMIGARNTPFIKLKADKCSVDAKLRKSWKREVNLQRRLDLERMRGEQEREESERCITQLKRRIELEWREGKKRETIL